MRCRVALIALCLGAGLAAARAQTTGPVATAVDDVVLRGLDANERATLRSLLQKVVTSREPTG